MAQPTMQWLSLAGTTITVSTTLTQIAARARMAHGSSETVGATGSVKTVTSTYPMRTAVFQRLCHTLLKSLIQSATCISMMA